MSPLPLYIPPLGTEIELATPWQFWLYAEQRNLTLFEALGEKPQGAQRWNLNWGERLLNPLQVELPAGTVLVLDRIYIRQGQDDFDSVTFKLKHCPTSLSPMAPKPRKGVRFWAKLEDVNRIEAVRTPALAPKPLQPKPYISEQDVQDLAAKLGESDYRVRYAIERHGSLGAAERALRP